jgi:nitrite reductase/ring-hydroxylating ferredoxin subunit
MTDLASPMTGGERRLCRLDEIPDGAARGFDPDGTGEDTVFAVRRGSQVHVYRNSCPHNARPLEYMRHRFLSGDGTEIVCYAHSAHFRIEDGVCVYGPCLGQALQALPARVEQDVVMVEYRRP